MVHKHQNYIFLSNIQQHHGQNGKKYIKNAVLNNKQEKDVKKYVVSSCLMLKKMV